MPRSSRILISAFAALVAISSVILYFSATVFMQLFMAFAIAYILTPPIDFLVSRGLGRIPAIIAVFLAAFGISAGLTVFYVYSISSEFSQMQLNVPDYAARLYEMTPLPVKGYLGIETHDKLVLRFNELLQQAGGIFPDLVKPLFNIIRKAFSSTMGVLLGMLGYLIIPVYLFYLLADMPNLKQFIESFIPERYRQAYTEKLAEVDTILSGFIRGQLLVCAILSVLYSIGLYFIGIDLAIAIGTLAGITFIIPYVGAILGICLSVLMAILKFHDVLHPLLCFGWFILVHALEGTFITPKIVGDTVGLHPLVAIIALLIGGQLFGITGMLLAVPVTAVLQVFFRSLSNYYHNSEFYRGA